MKKSSFISLVGASFLAAALAFAQSANLGKAGPGKPAATPPAVAPPAFQNPEGYNYDPTGKRDPFKAFGESQATQAPEPIVGPTEVEKTPEPLEAYEVTQFTLVGVIWQVRDPKAMVKDPTGKLHLIRKETKIGRNNGFVASIREGAVIIVEPSVGENGMQTAITRTLNLTP